MFTGFRGTPARWKESGVRFNSVIKEVNGNPRTPQLCFSRLESARQSLTRFRLEYLEQNSPTDEGEWADVQSRFRI